MDTESLCDIGILSPERPIPGASAAASSATDCPSVTSTPIPTPLDQTPTTGTKGKSNKKTSATKRRTPYQSVTRSERLKKKMSSSNPSQDEVMITDQISPSPGPSQQPAFDLKSYLTDQFSSLKAEIKCEVKDSVKQIASQVAANSAKIAEIDSGLDQRVAAAVSKEIAKLDGRMNPTITSPAITGNSSDYMRSRRSVRIWPVRCRDNDLWGSVGDFFYDILMIPKCNLPQDAVETIRRIVIGKRRNPPKIKDEVLVVFGNASTRDMIFSYASNLARFRDEPDRPGVRIDVPDQLKGVFGDLEKYGASLRRNLGPELKRSIKFDDSNRSMYIDVLFPGDQNWTKITYEVAKEEIQKQECESNLSARRRISSISSLSDTSSPAARAPNIVIPHSDTLSQFHKPNQPTAQSARWGPKL